MHQEVKGERDLACSVRDCGERLEADRLPISVDAAIHSVADSGNWRSVSVLVPIREGENAREVIFRRNFFCCSCFLVKGPTQGRGPAFRECGVFVESGQGIEDRVVDPGSGAQCVGSLHDTAGLEQLAGSGCLARVEAWWGLTVNQRHQRAQKPARRRQRLRPSAWLL